MRVAVIIMLPKIALAVTADFAELRAMEVLPRPKEAQTGLHRTLTRLGDKMGRPDYADRVLESSNRLDQAIVCVCDEVKASDQPDELLLALYELFYYRDAIDYVQMEAQRARDGAI